MNANNMKTQISMKLNMTSKITFISWICIFFPFRTQNTTSTYVLMDNFCPCLITCKSVCTMLENEL